jgi:hypothetical protein
MSFQEPISNDENIFKASKGNSIVNIKNKEEDNEDSDDQEEE